MLSEGEQTDMEKILDGFVPFNFTEGVPYISITRNGITFNKGVIMKMHFPRHVRLLINTNSKQVALQTCAEGTENAVLFCTEDKKDGKILSIRWNAKDLLNTLSDMMGWNLDDSSFRIDGKLLQSENAMLFDFNHAKELK